MKVFKFGGASVKDAEAVRNAGKIIQNYEGNLIVVISAMGKTTNLLELLAKAYFENSSEKWEIFSRFKSFHETIAAGLFNGNKTPASILQFYRAVEEKLNQAPSLDFNFEYDQLVCNGEMLSTLIVSEYLNLSGIKNKWVDIRGILRTDDTFREGVVDWELTEKLARHTFTFSGSRIYITQGFIGSTPANLTTTLGREGSDYTAAILGNILEAEYVAIWKDVPGVMNADPKMVSDTCMLGELSYREAIEMAYSGAQVIHPKTMKPLHNKRIPLLVKSFLDPTAEGTVIKEINHKLELPPVYIFKKNQMLITLSPNDFSFIGINDISAIFNLLSKYRSKINLFQQSAIDLNLVADFPESGFENIIKRLSSNYLIKYNTGLEMATIRYFTPDAVKRITEGKTVIIEQNSRRTARLVYK